MMRKKALLPFDSRYITMIENAYYFANPPESQAVSLE
jgi:regulator of nonsense transcripts 2